MFYTCSFDCSVEIGHSNSRLHRFTDDQPINPLHKHDVMAASSETYSKFSNVHEYHAKTHAQMSTGMWKMDALQVHSRVVTRWN